MKRKRKKGGDVVKKRRRKAEEESVVIRDMGSCHICGFDCSTTLYKEKGIIVGRKKNWIIILPDVKFKGRRVRHPECGPESKAWLEKYSSHELVQNLHNMKNKLKNKEKRKMAKANTKKIIKDVNTLLEDAIDLGLSGNKLNDELEEVVNDVLSVEDVEVLNKDTLQYLTDNDLLSGNKKFKKAVEAALKSTNGDDADAADDADVDDNGGDSLVGKMCNYLDEEDECEITEQNGDDLVITDSEGETYDCIVDDVTVVESKKKGSKKTAAKKSTAKSKGTKKTGGSESNLDRMKRLLKSKASNSDILKEFKTVYKDKDVDTEFIKKRIKIYANLAE